MVLKVEREEDLAIGMYSEKRSQENRARRQLSASLEKGFRQPPALLDLDLRLLVCRTMRTKFLLFTSPNLWHLVMASLADQDRWDESFVEIRAQTNFSLCLFFLSSLHPQVLILRALINTLLHYNLHLLVCLPANLTCNSLVAIGFPLPQTA